MDTVQVGNGSGLMIQNTGSSLLNTSHNSFRLNNVLYCPQAASNLLSINQFCLDSNCYFILTGTTFFVKENKTRRLLLQGLVENGLYPINGNKSCTNKFRCFTSKLGIKATRDQWYKCLGHPSNSTLNYLSSFLQIKDSPSKPSVCSSCQLGKAKKLPFSDSPRQSARPLALIHIDVWISHVPSAGGYRYYVLFIDDFIRFTWMYPIRFKSDVFSIFQQYKVFVENLFSCTIQQLQSDNGGEYLSIEFQNFLAEHGIFHRLTCPYTSLQNGIVERKHRHIQEIGLTLLAQACLPNCYWVDAFLTSVYLINRLPTKVLNNITPYFVLHKTMSRYSDLRTFGCACYPYRRPYEKHKLAFRSKQCIFLGYSNQQKGYRCLDFATGRVFISRHVVFDEDIFPHLDKSHSSTTPASNQSSSTTLSFNIVPLISHAQHFNFTPPVIPTNSSATESPPYTESPPLQPSAIETPIPTPSSTNHVSLSDPSSCPAMSPILPSPVLPSSTNHVSLTDPSSSPAMSPVLPRQMVTRSKTGSLKPKEFPGFKTFYSTRHPLRVLSSIVIESDFTKAVSNRHWKVAMRREFNALLANNTWSLCLRPSHTHVVRNKWVYKLKRHLDGSIDRYKARLVAKGFEQIPCIDYFDTFSPVVKPTTIRSILSLAVSFKWNIRQLDVSNAFLHGILDEEVYMKQPKGYEDQTFPNHVCYLHKSIYGLKQAPRAWFKRLSQQLIDFGFLESKMDYSLFTYNSDTLRVFVLVYVDDIIITGSDVKQFIILLINYRMCFQLKTWVN